MNATRCIFPKGKLHGQCVECPVDTLYEYVQSYSFQPFDTGDWYQTHLIWTDQSYHRCVQVCSPKYPFISSNRVCASSCSGTEMQIGDRKFCKDKNVNIGFCLVNVCPVHGFKCYYMECFKECPVFTVSYNNSCVFECFDDQPYILNGECVRQCPEGYVLDVRVCEKTCTNGRFRFNKTCVDKCPRSKEYVDKHQCVSECPLQKFYQDKLCVKNCSEGFVLDGRICRTKCPLDLFESNKACVDICPNLTFVENKKCVDNCSSGFYRYKAHCVETCPPENFINETNKICDKKCEGFKYYQKKNIFCVNNCPEKMFEVNSTCVTHCPKSRPFSHERSCLAKCPDSSKFVEKKIEMENTITYTCVKKCKKYKTYISNMCVEACSAEKVLFQDTCQEQCPASDPFKVHMPTVPYTELNLTSFLNITSPINAYVICAKICPSNFVNYNEECYVECPNANKSKTFNMSCSEHCPEEYPFVIKQRNRYICTNHCEKMLFQGLCLDKCPDSHAALYKGECADCSQFGMYEENQRCVNSCSIVRFENRCFNHCPPAAKFMYNKTCSSSCPSNASKVDEQHHELSRLYVCTDECPSDKFISGNNCVSSCPDSKRLPIDGKCVACNEVGKYDDGSKCVDKCPNLYHEYLCVDECLENFKIFNETCVRQCPITAPLRSVIVNYKTNRPEYRCVENCHDKYLINGKDCVSGCDLSQFISNKTCVEKCPIDAPYISYKYGSYYNTKECLKHCNGTEYSLNFSCFSKCPNGFHGHKSQCLQKCPIDFPYVNLDGICVESCNNLRQGMNCYEKCPQGTFQYNQTCVQNCPSTKPYNYKDNCVQTCQDFLIKKTCYEQCPSGLVGYHKKCFLHCPSQAKYRYKWECFQKCPKYTLLGSTNYTCFDTCPDGQFRYHQKCIEKCPSHMPYDLEGECVGSCDGYLDGLKCYHRCPNEMFTYTGKCISKCPKEAPFIDNKTCIPFCPNVYDDNFKCMKECPEYTYPHGKHCKPGCSQSFPFINSVFGEQVECVEKCNALKLSTENHNCIYRSECTGFIYDDVWCYQKCPSDTYILRSTTENLCYPRKPVYIMIGVLSLCVSIAITFGTRVVYCYYKIRQVFFLLIDIALSFSFL